MQQMLTVGFHELFNINCTLCSLSCSLLLSLLHLGPRSHQPVHWEVGEHSNLVQGQNQFCVTSIYSVVH